MADADVRLETIQEKAPGPGPAGIKFLLGSLALQKDAARPARCCCWLR